MLIKQNKKFSIIFRPNATFSGIIAVFRKNCFSTC